MNYSSINLKFKKTFRNLNYYSMPYSILFIVRKRLNFVFFFIFLILNMFFIIL